MRLRNGSVRADSMMARERMLPHTGRMYACNRMVHLMTRDLAALLARESFEVFSAKLKQGAKKPSTQDSLRLTVRARMAL
jgi:hypothetical protein